MSSIINTNISSMTAQRNLGMSQSALATSMQRLSSGLRINSAKDDAAGLAISERMSAQIRGNNQAARNANDGISLAQTAEGDLAQIGGNLQRMRELAVQSSNATNSSSDRAALDNEVQALSAEIDRVSQNSAFNGVKLLDGSFSAQKFQVGANNTAADSISINAIASARTSQLGGVGTSFTATTTSGRSTAALAAGDLTLNGFQVGAAQVGTAPGQSTASAFSIAAVINTVTSSSNVTATANANTVTGTGVAITSPTSIAANTFSINGVNVGVVVAGGNAAGQGANVAAAINLVSGQSGVTASADATSGALTLSAADGRDISIGLNGTAADLATAGNNKTTLMNQTGLATANVGTQGYSTGGAVAAVNNIQKMVRPASNDWTMVNGVKFTYIQGASTNVTVVDAFSVTVTDNFSAMQLTFSPEAATSLANAITVAKGNPLTATALATVNVSTSTSNVILTDVTPGVSTTTTSTSSFLNDRLSNVTLGAAATAGGTVAAIAADNHGTVTLSSTNASGIVYGGAHAAYAGLSTGGASIAATISSSVSSIASMDVLTAANATKALSTIDGALATVSSSRAALGAIQNRFNSVVTSLQTTSENLTASRSRIQDADFAAETANLSRAQILQQAGTAMVAQANQLPQGVLALLR
jgi:flagellin